MKKFDPLGDGLSSVELVDHMGDDLRVVNAARICFDKQSHLEVDETGYWLSPEDGKLIGFLAEHRHVSPFFHPQVCLRIEMPSFLAHQWWRSTVGVCRSEVYRRYVVSEPDCYLPKTWRLKGSMEATTNQRLDEAASRDLSTRIEQVQQQINALYREALAMNVAPELAQMILPQSTYTHWIETGSLHYYARVHALQTGAAAQPELRRYAEAVAQILSDLFPVSWKALTTAQ
jgi:thymidylate synthase (FAD)